MNTHPLSIAAWVGGGIAGAAYARKHRLAGGALGAMLIGGISDSLIERHELGMPIAAPAILGVGIIGLTWYVIAPGAR